jgi:DnaK suppressor protein
MACALPLFQTQPYESSFTLSRGPNVRTALAIWCRIAISPLNQAGARLARGLNPLKDTDGMLISLPPDYRPSDDEEFMNPMQTEYFRQKLLRWRGELVKEANGTLASLGEGGILEADITDRASVETDRALELRTRDRARKLIGKIDQALQRIENGSYGYCEETGEPIGLKRLEARPIATLSIEAQERHERMEKVHRDD